MPAPPVGSLFSAVASSEAGAVSLIAHTNLHRRAVFDPWSRREPGEILYLILIKAKF